MSDAPTRRRKAYIMRGIPGAGKSTWLRDNAPLTVVFSADSFHTDSDGVYRYDPAKAGAAHDACLKGFTDWLVYADGQPQTDVAVDNTNTTLAEIAPYYRLAEAFGLDVEVVWVVADPRLAAERGRHAVPAATVARMAMSVEPLPPRWKVRYVSPGAESAWGPIPSDPTTPFEIRAGGR